MNRFYPDDEPTGWKIQLMQVTQSFKRTVRVNARGYESALRGAADALRRKGYDPADFRVHQIERRWQHYNDPS